MKLRLFWAILLAFSLVIVLGVCGMLTFFGLAFAGIWQPGGPGGNGVEQRAIADSLADYYIAHGNSWDGVQRRMAELPSGMPWEWSELLLLDAEGRVLASTKPGLPADAQIDARGRERGVPVLVHGVQVGSLLRHMPGDVWPAGHRPRRGPPDFLRPVVRGLFVAGLGLIGTLLLLAILFARRVSRPIHRLTAAAQRLAAGEREVQVSGASLRELDDLAQAFNRMARALAQADRQRRQMTADIAHELRTPLTIIKGRLEGLQDGVYQATPDQIERLREETALLERLVEDLRLLALAEAGQLPLYRESVAPGDLLEDAAASFAGQAAEHQVTLHVAVSADLPELNVDPQRIAQVLANLISNALRYTPPGGSITLAAQRLQQTLPPPSASPPRAAVVLQVSDTGQGIAPEDLPNIFERFWRADRARARASGGGGLGLAIAKQIVTAHGGTIWAASTLGQGTTISIALPVAQT